MNYLTSLFHTNLIARTIKQPMTATVATFIKNDKIATAALTAHPTILTAARTINTISMVMHPNFFKEYIFITRLYNAKRGIFAFSY